MPEFRSDYEKSSIPRGNQKTPVFGSKMKLGLKTSNLPNDAISSLQFKEEFETMRFYWIH